MTTGEYASDGLWPRTDDSAHKKLALGILCQALSDLLDGSERADAERWKRDARQWFCSNSELPGSFNWVCSALRLDPGRLRKWVIERSQQLRGSGRQALRHLCRLEVHAA